MHLVHETRAQILSDRGDSAAQPDVAIARIRSSLLQRCVNSLGDEVEHRTAFHHDRRARMVREHERGHMIRRLLAPPALPALVGPRAADGTEHVPAQDPGAEPAHALLGDPVVHAGLAALEVMHRAPVARGEVPLEQLGAADPEWIVDVLIQPGAVAVQRDRKARDTELGHRRWSVTRPWPRERPHSRSSYPPRSET